MSNKSKNEEQVAKEKPKNEGKAVKEKPKKPKKPKNYINNKDLMKELRLSNEQGKMTDELGKMVYMLCHRYGYKEQFNVCSSFRDDMISFAVLTIVKFWKNFNCEKYNNPFAYFTQVAKSAFYQYQNYERKHRQIKDEMLVTNGYNPSFTYEIEHEFQVSLERYEAQKNPDINYDVIASECEEHFNNKEDSLYEDGYEE